jgi:hypothetical protein
LSNKLVPISKSHDGVARHQLTRPFFLVLFLVKRVGRKKISNVSAQTHVLYKATTVVINPPPPPPPLQYLRLIQSCAANLTDREFLQQEAHFVQCCFYYGVSKRDLRHPAAKILGMTSYLHTTVPRTLFNFFGKVLLLKSQCPNIFTILYMFLLYHYLLDYIIYILYH